jgi:hypothetical protein
MMTTIYDVPLTPTAMMIAGTYFMVYEMARCAATLCALIIRNEQFYQSSIR